MNLTLEKLIEIRDLNKAMLDKIDGMSSKDRSRIIERKRLEAWNLYNGSLLKISIRYEIKDPVNHNKKTLF